MLLHSTRLRGGLALLLVSSFSSAFADTSYNAGTEYRDRIKVAQTIQPIGDAPFGENINMYKGGLSFRQTDISYPGIGPTITISRSYTIGGNSARANFPGFGDWEPSIPRIETTLPGDRFSDFGEWKTAGGYNRCSSFGSVQVAPYLSFGMQWWNGYQMITPDGASQPLLKRVTENTIKPAGATSYNVVTAGHWMLSCIPISNTPGPNGIQGEGFLALGPDGTKIWYDYLAYGPAMETLLYEAHQPIQFLPRKKGYLLATRIEDRFGNYITYTYNASARPTAINGSDGRQVSLTYGTGGVSSITIQPGTPAAQTWTYTYGNGLTSVELPDHSKWLFAMNGAASMDMMSDPQGCGGMSSLPTSPPTTLTVTHPSGLVGTFNVDYRDFGRSKVPNVCNPPTMDSPESDTIPPNYTAIALMSKTIAGPGVPSQTWTYNYGGIASTDPNCFVTGCTAAMYVDVGAPDGTSTRYTHNAEWGPYEGKLLSVIAGQTASTPALQTTLYEYAAPDQGLYPVRLGDNSDNTVSVNNGPIEYLTPQNKVTTTLQGVSFVRSVTQFDLFGNPKSVTKSSTGGSGGNSSRTETLEYTIDPSAVPSRPLPGPGQWVLGQVITSKAGPDAQNLVVTGKADYHATSVLPVARYGFGGLLQQTLTYNANGTIATVKDGNNNVISLSDWYRGIPRRIDFPTPAYITATVDAAGKITGTTDELQSTTGYSYDLMGRLGGITYPTGDTTVWNPLTRSFVSVASAEYGLPAGHWKETVQTGNGRTTTFYDGRWLPVLSLTEDTASAATRSFVVKRYDAMGRLVFQSYPVATLTSINDSLNGVSTEYDSLGRVIASKQNSELGLLTTTTEYLTGFRTKVTNPRLNSTTTSYQVFDAPSTDAPVRIEAPLNVTTTITRDIFGKPLSINRQGPGN